MIMLRSIILTLITGAWVSSFWEDMEIKYYGDPQPSDTDTAIFIILCVFMFIMYYKILECRALKEKYNEVDTLLKVIEFLDSREKQND